MEVKLDKSIWENVNNPEVGRVMSLHEGKAIVQLYNTELRGDDHVRRVVTVSTQHLKRTR